MGLLLLITASFLYFLLQRKQNFLEEKLASTEAALKLSNEVETYLRDELKNVNNKLKVNVEDPISNLLGWQLFEDRIKHGIFESERYQFTMGLLLVDVDDFKLINEALGYKIGDVLLREVGKRLLACVRQVDSVTRFAKDTFAILLVQLAKPETAVVVAQRIFQAFREPFYLADQEFYITVSIGISIYPNDGRHATELLRNADYALQLSKQSGKRTYKFYEENLHSQSVRELALHTGLNRENIFEEFNLCFEPIVNVSNEDVFCMDAILYWKHFQLGVIEQNELFNYADKQRKLNQITLWLIEQACRQLISWRNIGFTPKSIGVPVYVKQLENTQFIYQISHIIQGFVFEPKWLMLQLIGHDTDKISSSLQKSFNMLKYIGTEIALDRFSSSAAFSMLALKDVPCNYLKLDPTLIENIEKDEKAQALIKSILQLANNLGVAVIVQGIERKEQIIALKILGCELMQGRFLGAPLSANEVSTKMTLKLVKE